MGIFDAMNTSVGGLQAQSYALQNISGNIANSSTTGYKGIGTSFVDLIPDSSVPSKQVAGGVTANAKATITTQGTISGSTVATNMAITGDGFFSIQKATGIVDNVPVFSGVTYYTRRGDFQLNANGNLVNGAGYYLMGVTVDPKTGQPTGQRGDGPEVPEQLHPGAGDHLDPVRGEPADPAEHGGEHDGVDRHAAGGWRTQSVGLLSQPAARGHTARPLCQRDGCRCGRHG
ncbi:flagellar hook-basal body protein [Bradyrhizobium sp. LM3.6]